MLKRTLSILIILMFILVGLLTAHPGKLDKRGGHCDHKKKEYHYHKNGKVVKRSKANYKKICAKKKHKKSNKKKTNKKSKNSDNTKKTDKKTNEKTN